MWKGRVALGHIYATNTDPESLYPEASTAIQDLGLGESDVNKIDGQVCTEKLASSVRR